MISDDRERPGADTVIASIENQSDPTQCVQIHYMRNDNVFVTEGIVAHFGEKEISIPSHMVVMDFQLMGTILSQILERLSAARDGETTFQYASRLQVMDRVYSLKDEGEYMMLRELESS